MFHSSDKKKPNTAQTDWPWPQVKAALEECGTNLQQLAIANNVDNSLLTKAKYQPVARAEAMIAVALGLAASEIWPTRYTAEGIPVSTREWCKRFKPTTSRPARNVQNQKVA